MTGETMSARNGVLALAALLACSPASAVDKPAGNVCPDPQRPCPGFNAHDLSFGLVNDGKARAEQRSPSFFAVVLKTIDPCATREKERLEIQALFPDRKVFTNRFDCDDNPENNVAYTNTSAKHGFIAVYAGGDRAAADKVLAAVKATGKFPGANLRRMQVVYVYP
jgi:hypothetical protein